MHQVPLQLPSLERQDRLLAGLANLVRLRGPDALVAAPVLLPTNKYFPDAWSPTVRGIKRLIRRLMCYAGLPDLRISLQPYEREDAQQIDEHGQLVPTLESTAAAWFGGIEGDVCSFGLDVTQLDDPEQMVGTLCHEVAHAYRAFHDLRVASSDIEEALTDLTTVYLGFGVLTCNNTYRYRTTGQVRGAFASFATSASSSGYLDTGEMCLLLAVQAVVRGLEGKGLRAWTRELETTQRELFEKALKELPDRDELLETLALPAPDTWPKTRSRKEILRPLDEHDDDGDEAADVDLTAAPDRRTRSAGQNTFRVLHHRADRGGFVGGGFGVVFGFIVYSISDGNTLLVLLVFAVCGGIGFFAGRGHTYTLCSDPMCEARIADTDETCPGCGARVRGTIDHAEERLAAEEALEAEVLPPPRTAPPPVRSGESSRM